MWTNCMQIHSILIVIWPLLVSIPGSVYICNYIVWCRWKRCYVYIHVLFSVQFLFNSCMFLVFTCFFLFQTLNWLGNFCFYFLLLYLKASHIGVSIHKIAQKVSTKKRYSDTMTKGTINLICNNLPVERSSEQECMWRTAIKSIESLKNWPI